MAKARFRSAKITKKNTDPKQNHKNNSTKKYKDRSEEKHSKNELWSFLMMCLLISDTGLAAIVIAITTGNFQKKK